MCVSKIRRNLAPIKIEQTTLLKFFPFLSKPKNHSLIVELDKRKEISDGKGYTLRMRRDGTIYIRETHCLNCGFRLIKNGHNPRIAIFDNGLGRHEFCVHRKRCPNCGEIRPDYSKLAPKYCNYQENFRRRARQHYMEGLMPSQIKRVFRIDFGVEISKSTIVNWINEVIKPLREMLKETPFPSSGYWAYDEIHMLVGGKKAYALTTVDTLSRFIPIAKISSHMDNKSGRLLFREARRNATLKINGIVKDCTTHLGKLLKTRSYKHMLQQNCKTHVKWIASKHVKAYIGMSIHSRKPVPPKWLWLLRRFYNVIDAKNETEAYVKLEILRSDINNLIEVRPRKHKHLITAFTQIEKWLPKLIAHCRDPNLAATNNVLEGYHKKFEYYPSFKRNMMTHEGAQRVLDYRVFGHNFKKFPEALKRLEKRYEEYRTVFTKDGKNPDLMGQGMHFKHRRIKLNRWYQNYYQLWEQYFAII